MTKYYVITRDEYGWGKQMELAELAELMKPFLVVEKPDPEVELKKALADNECLREALKESTERISSLEARPLQERTDTRLLALDAAKQRAELALAEAQQEIAALREDKFKHAAMLGAVMRQRDEYRAQADAARQAATEAAQRADAAEAKLAALHSPRPAYQD